jgi:hypothetical protein
VLERQPAKPERQIEREKPREEPAGRIRPQTAPVEKAKPGEAPVEKATPRAAPVERAKPEQLERGKARDADKKDEGGGGSKGKARENKGTQDNSSRDVRDRDDVERPRSR